MNHTTNLHLPQWEESDRIMRTDFNDAMSAIDDALAACGNCKIETGSYVGTGAYGSGTQNTLTFSGKPTAVFVTGDRSFWALYGNTTASVEYGSGGNLISVTWTENSISWYHDTNAYTQMNVSGATYYYMALLATE